MDEKLKIIIEAETANFKKEIESAKDSMKSFKDRVEFAKKDVDKNFKQMGNSISTAMKATALGLAGAGLGFAKGVKDTAAYGDAIDKMSQKMGFSAKGYQEWDFILQHSGTSMETLKASMKTLTTAAESNSDAFERLGITQEELSNSNPEQLFEQTITALQGVENETERTALAGKLLGRGATELGPVFNTSAESIEEMKTAVNEMGGVMSDAAVKDAAAFQDALQDLNVATSGLFREFISDNLPAITEGITNLTEKIGPLKDRIGDILENIAEHKSLFAAVGLGIGIIVGAIEMYNAVAAIKLLMDAAEVTSIGGLIAAYAAQAVAMAAALAPYLLITAAIAGVIAVIVICIRRWDEIKKKVLEVVDKTKKKIDDWKAKFDETEAKISDFTSSAKAKFEDMKKGINDKIEGVKAIVKKGVQKLKEFFNFEWKLPKIKLPHFKISGHFSLDPPSIPRFSVNWYAKGGVFDKPNLFGYGNGMLGGLGEAGAEAVVPLEKNTEWLDKIAERLRGNGNQNIILQVDGRVFGEVAVDSINSLTRQTGALQLKLV